MYELILEFARAFGTPFAACVGAFVAHRFGTIQADIARQQAQTASGVALTSRNKLRMDMYAERLAIYKAVRSVFGELGVMGRLTPEDERNYLVGIESSRWVFGKEMHEFLEVKVWRAIIDYVAAQNEYNYNSNTDLRAQLATAKAERRKELLTLRDEVDHRFAEFMEFEHDPTTYVVQRTG